MPYGWQEYNKPEKAFLHVLTTRWKFDPTVDIPLAIAQELQGAHFFKNAFFTRDESQGDLVLKGTLGSTKYEGKQFHYGVSLLAGVFWLILPSHQTMNYMEMQLSLTDRTNGKIVWNESIQMRSGELHWIYTAVAEQFVHRETRYPEMLKQQMPSILSDMKADLKEYGW